MALALSACAGPLEPLPEGPSQNTECGYVEADEAAQQAAHDYYAARQAGANRARLNELEAAKESAESRRQYADDCEQRAREWADLLAQQQSARAAISTAQTAQASIIWTFFEILALVATIGIGIAAIVITRRASKDEIAAIKEEGVNEAARFERELAEAKRVGDTQFRAWVHFQGCGIQKAVAVNLAKRTETVTGFRLSTRLRNTGATPALDCGTYAGAVFVEDQDDGAVLANMKAFIADIEAKAGNKARGTVVVFPNFEGGELYVDKTIPAADFLRWVTGRARLFVGFAIQYRTMNQPTDTEDRITCMLMEVTCGASEGEFMDPNTGTPAEWFKSAPVPGTTKIT